MDIPQSHCSGKETKKVEEGNDTRDMNSNHNGGKTIMKIEKGNQLPEKEPFYNSYRIHDRIA